ncbi:carbohydrate kinase, FGGY [Indibacter alkaliphilus LW1]|uniref:Carbohydrate kinase, FGGY n=1 Tax=Indibacter alkaliphilus (strain CCUG 57479 / KCTC 22604 / LW1) TaxID=1189612 RepID=S2D7Z0_INDAL|nr:FGGY-family carbohydrate kinase [Indibacter alkaliphilus]EOZ95337.1 carbohydrate kinase, FGGY [Indibacter alkaliphilus LW1]
MNRTYFFGLDVGTQGVRGILVDSFGEVVAQSQKEFPLNVEMRQEQSPLMWWDKCVEVISNVLRSNNAIKPESILGIAVTSTSGTVIPLDSENRPIHNALMYSDKRASVISAKVISIASNALESEFIGFNESSGLAKIVWFGQAFPEKAKKVRKWVHAADYISGKLSGVWGLTDFTNALKSGYDVQRGYWPDFIEAGLGISKEILPEVIPSGSVIGYVKSDVSSDTGLSSQTKVVVGMTDGCASQIASGALKPGDWNTTIGTTMVIKGVTEKRVTDSEGRVYSHRHPQGFWMPGGASNIGSDWVKVDFNEGLEKYEKESEKLIPTGLLSYPLMGKGERFPFLNKEAVGFKPMNINKNSLFSANMEGVAYLEKYSFALMNKLSGEEIKAVFTAGGGSKNKVWVQIRSDVLNLPVIQMKYTSGAFGAAVLASSQTYYKNLIEAGSMLIQPSRTYYPNTQRVSAYADHYKEYVALLVNKGYIKT